MEAEKIYQTRFLPLAKYLLKELDYYGNSQFRKQTSASPWTIGQLYHHIIQGTEEYHMKSIKQCLDQKGGTEKGNKSFLGYLVFLFDRIPFKLKGVSDYIPLQIENTDKAKDMLYGFIKDMHKLALEIDKNNNPQYKVKHRKLGRLNALEWYAFIAIHIQHHIDQKHKIDKIIRVFNKDEVFENSTEIV